MVQLTARGLYETKQAAFSTPKLETDDEVNNVRTLEHPRIVRKPAALTKRFNRQSTPGGALFRQQDTVPIVGQYHLSDTPHRHQLLYIGELTVFLPMGHYGLGTR